MTYIIRFEVRNVGQTIGKEVDRRTLDEVNKFHEDMCKLYGTDLASFRVYEFLEERPCVPIKREEVKAPTIDHSIVCDECNERFTPPMIGTRYAPIVFYDGKSLRKRMLCPKCRKKHDMDG